MYQLEATPDFYARLDQAITAARKIGACVVATETGETVWQPADCGIAHRVRCGELSRIGYIG